MAHAKREARTRRGSGARGEARPLRPPRRRSRLLVARRGEGRRTSARARRGGDGRAVRRGPYQRAGAPQEAPSCSRLGRPSRAACCRNARGRFRTSATRGPTRSRRRPPSVIFNVTSQTSQVVDPHVVVDGAAVDLSTNGTPLRLNPGQPRLPDRARRLPAEHERVRGLRGAALHAAQRRARSAGRPPGPRARARRARSWRPTGRCPRRRTCSSPWAWRAWGASPAGGNRRAERPARPRLELLAEVHERSDQRRAHEVPGRRRLDGRRRGRPRGIRLDVPAPSHEGATGHGLGRGRPRTDRRLRQRAVRGHVSGPVGPAGGQASRERLGRGPEVIVMKGRERRIHGQRAGEQRARVRERRARARERRGPSP